tara:strand:- start:768 stop:1487 length:720 start_codon:yes stop_codon:yes gene_type:complete
MNTFHSSGTVTAPDGVILAVNYFGPANPTTAPIVATHGWANDQTVWAPMVNDLGGDHRITTWDLRGHGDSDTPPVGNYTRAQVLDDLTAICDCTAKDRPVVLMGHSLGGFLSLAYALKSPANVAALVLVASGPGFRKATAREEWNQSVLAAARTMGQAAGVEEISMHYDSYVIDHLSKIEAPTMLLLGEHDKRFAASAALFERHLDIRAKEVIPSQGHMVHLKAAPSCAIAVRNFLNGI